MTFRITKTALLPALLTVLILPASAADEAAPPQVGNHAEDFELAKPDGKKLKLSTLREQGPVVVVVLRGYPGYQCPVCTQQVTSLVANASKFRDAGARVVLVYPGAASRLNQRAREFLGNSKLPAHFDLVVDPDYEFTNTWHLRWDAAGETAYPSTFVVGKEGKVTYAKISKSHGDRAAVADVLQAIPTN
jgi:peroxiredoxin